MQNRLELIKVELEKNAELKATLKTKIKTQKIELSTLQADTEADPDALALAKEKLFNLDKQYNKACSDFYFLMAEEKEEKQKQGVK